MWGWGLFKIYLFFDNFTYLCNVCLSFCRRPPPDRSPIIPKKPWELKQWISCSQRCVVCVRISACVTDCWCLHGSLTDPVLLLKAARATKESLRMPIRNSYCPITDVFAYLKNNEHQKRGLHKESSWHGGACLYSQHSGVTGRQISVNFKPAWSTYKAQAQWDPDSKKKNKSHHSLIVIFNRTLTILTAHLSVLILPSIKMIRQSGSSRYLGSLSQSATHKQREIGVSLRLGLDPGHSSLSALSPNSKSAGMSSSNFIYPVHLFFFTLLLCKKMLLDFRFASCVWMVLHDNLKLPVMLDKVFHSSNPSTWESGR